MFERHVLTATWLTGETLQEIAFRLDLEHVVWYSHDILQAPLSPFSSLSKIPSFSELYGIMHQCCIFHIVYCVCSCQYSLSDCIGSKETPTCFQFDYRSADWVSGYCGFGSIILCLLVSKPAYYQYPSCKIHTLFWYKLCPHNAPLSQCVSVTLGAQ